MAVVFLRTIQAVFYTWKYCSPCRHFTLWVNYHSLCIGHLINNEVDGIAYCDYRYISNFAHLQSSSENAFLMNITSVKCVVCLSSARTEKPVPVFVQDRQENNVYVEQLNVPAAGLSLDEEVIYKVCDYLWFTVEPHYNLYHYNMQLGITQNYYPWIPWISSGLLIWLNLNDLWINSPTLWLIAIIMR